MTNSLHSFVDFYDYSYYLDHMVMIGNGQIPYVDFRFDYPPLAILPMLAVYAVSKTNITVFTLLFESIMILCDALTIAGIYTLSLMIWNNRRRAFLAGLLYACSLPIAYFTLTKFDALPTMILVWSVLLAIEGKKQSYLVNAIGAFTKVFPVIAMPFIFLWNIKTKDWKKEIIFPLVAICGLAVVIVIPFMLFGAKITDIFTVLERGTVYPNTPIYLLHIYSGIPAETIGTVFLVLAVLGISSLIYRFWKGRKSPVLLLMSVMLAAVILVFCSPLHSPQYIMWFTPFLCLLVADDVVLMGLLITTHILAYIEFPLLFGGVYTNLGYVNPTIATAFFSIEYLVMAILTKQAGSPPAKAGG